MKQYEYDVVTNSEYIKAKFLTAQGEQGWELVSHTYIPGSTVPHVYTFKREKIGLPKGIANTLTVYQGEDPLPLYDGKTGEQINKKRFKLDDSFKKTLEEEVDPTIAATADFLNKEQGNFEEILEREMKAFAKKIGWGVKEDTMEELLNEYNKPETRERLTELRDQENMFWENPILYAKLENMIIEWSNDETKTAGELTREILKLIK
jgi:hypothetical protein